MVTTDATDGLTLDRLIWEFMQAVTDGSYSWSHAATEVVRDITALGSNIVLLLIVAAVAGFLVIKQQRSLALWLALTALFALLLNWGLKEFFGRVRPDVVYQAAKVFTPSFPSAHAMLSATVYSALGVLAFHTQQHPTKKLFFIGVAGLLILLVGFSRMYLGVHWFTDVLVGWILGLLVTWGSWECYRKITHRARAHL